VKLGWRKVEFKDALYACGIPVWHANFELINSLSLFAGDAWRDWLPNADHVRLKENYGATFPEAARIHRSSGLGLAKMNFLSRQNLRYLMKQIDKLAARQAKCSG
jgi:hypothetical protein